MADSNATLVLQALVQSGKVSFTKYDIAVEAFRAFPKHFAMSEYPQFPDSNKVWALLYGKMGLVNGGYLANVNGRFIVRSAPEFQSANGIPADAIDEDAAQPRCKVCKQVDGLIDGICTSNQACQKKRR